MLMVVEPRRRDYDRGMGWGRLWKDWLISWAWSAGLLFVAKGLWSGPWGILVSAVGGVVIATAVELRDYWRRNRPLRRRRLRKRYQRPSP
jgi:hypothetical protein